MMSQLTLGVETFRRLKAFPWMSDEQLSRFVESMTLTAFLRHSLIFPEGATSETMYVLLKGVVKLSVERSRKDALLVSLIRPGELFGITSLLPGVPRVFRAEAFIDSWVAAFQPEALVRVFPGVSFKAFSAFMSDSIGRWFALLQRYTNFQVLGGRQKLATVFLELAHKFGVEDARGSIIRLQLTHDQLAELVGASRPRVTEYIREFERQELLFRDGRRFVVRQQLLHQFLDLGQPGSKNR